MCTGVFATLADHSLPILLDAGASITINTDDPPMCSTALNEEYQRIATAVDEFARLVIKASLLGSRPKLS